LEIKCSPLAFKKPAGLSFLNRVIIRNSVIRKILTFICLFFIAPLPLLCAEQRHILQTDDVKVVFEEPLQVAAENLATIYPRIKSELEVMLNWQVNFRPTIVLVKDGAEFQKMVKTSLFVAFAMPRKQLIVIDDSKMNMSPFSIGITLKHELCHLLIHHYIERDNLPKWLDEGVAQWTSDGLSELIMDHKRSVLDKAILSGNHIPLNRLTHRFPRDKISLALAYEESKRFVLYMEDEFGKNGILNLLKYLEQGNDIDTATQKAFSLSLAELEKQWQDQLRQKNTWLTYVAINIYEILFFITSMITVYGFIRHVIRKRNYQDDDEEAEEKDDGGDGTQAY